MAPSTTHRRPLPGTDLELFPLCLGGNVFGFTVAQEDAFAILDAYVEAGGNTIDTADSYCHWIGSNGGESETIIGRWMAARRNRDQIVLATKVGQLPGRDNLRAETIRDAVEGSLRRLQSDRIDLYYAHQDHGDPLEETLSAFDALVRAGKVRHIAASNYSAQRLDEALNVSAQHGFAQFVALQPQYNLMHRTEYEQELGPLCADRGLGVLPWWGLACGYLTGKYRLGAKSVQSQRAGFVEQYVNAEGERVLAVLDLIAADHGVAPAAVALSWLAARPGVVASLASARTPGQLAELLPMAGLTLTAQEVVRLNEASVPAARVEAASV
jgi:aryl-alcohol dehydrogenase-like predicted oxidoreductase